MLTCNNESIYIKQESIYINNTKCKVCPIAHHSWWGECDKYSKQKLHRLCPSVWILIVHILSKRVWNIRSNANSGGFLARIESLCNKRNLYYILIMVFISKFMKKHNCWLLFSGIYDFYFKIFGKRGSKQSLFSLYYD